MTVKRRLFISNILMLIIPVLLCVIVGTVVVRISLNLLGLAGDRDFNSNSHFNKVVMQLQHLIERAKSSPDSVQVIADVAEFDKQYKSYGIKMAIYQDERRLYASEDFTDDLAVKTILANSDNNYVIIDEDIVYKKNLNDIVILLKGEGYFFQPNEFDNTENWDSVIYFYIILFALIVTVVLITNLTLTSMMYKSIINPLNTLVCGVHSLRDGNLDYRISYSGKDEFAGACDDFNEMAAQLLLLVNARLKDDENRRELIAGISHDLRTPLTSIKAYIEGLETGVAATPEIQARYFNIIKNKTADLEHIVSQLFLFSKLDVGEFPFQLESFDVAEELKNFIDGVNDEYKNNGLQIILSEPMSHVIINADKVQFRNVLINILENSRKYGGSENNYIRIACYTDTLNAIITLADNGVGVPEESLAKLFTVFYRNDKARTNPGSGSGLGLAITAKILERLGGSIKAENAAEGGLEITITLPIATGGNASEADIDN